MYVIVHNFLKYKKIKEKPHTLSAGQRNRCSQPVLPPGKGKEALPGPVGPDAFPDLAGRPLASQTSSLAAREGHPYSKALLSSLWAVRHREQPLGGHYNSPHQPPKSPETKHEGMKVKTDSRNGSEVCPTPKPSERLSPQANLSTH